MRKFVVLAFLFAMPQVAFAALTFQQLGDQIFTVSHAVKWFGGRGAAMDLVYEKASSVCIAAGFSHLKVLSQESTAGSDYETPNATIRMQLFDSGIGEGLIKCELKAHPKYVDEAERKLKRRGYHKVALADAAAQEAGQGTCSIEQIMTMTKSGFTDEQIKAACPDSN